MGLEDKTLTEVRELAQSLGIQDIFSKTRNKLEQEISLKQQPIDGIISIIDNPPIVNDLNHPTVLDTFIARGLRYREDEDRWYMFYGEKTDEGTLTMPELNLIRCAERLMA